MNRKRTRTGHKGNTQLSHCVKKHSRQNNASFAFVSLNGFIGDTLGSFCFPFLLSGTIGRCEKSAAAPRLLAAGPTFLLTAGVINVEEAGAILHKPHKSLLEPVKAPTFDSPSAQRCYQRDNRPPALAYLF